MGKYRKKPIVIDALQMNPMNVANHKKWVESLGDNYDDHFRFIDQGPDGAALKVKTLEGELNISPGDFIIRGVNGEYYPCKPDIFAKTYEIVGLTAP